MELITTLVFAACLAGSQPTDCQDVRVNWDGSLQQCAFYGQTEVINWLNQHPSRVLRGGYRCTSEPSGLEGRAA